MWFCSVEDDHNLGLSLLIWLITWLITCCSSCPCCSSFLWPTSTYSYGSHRSDHPATKLFSISYVYLTIKILIKMEVGLHWMVTYSLWENISQSYIKEQINSFICIKFIYFSADYDISIGGIFPLQSLLGEVIKLYFTKFYCTLSLQACNR